jgi:hypothetical protein
MGRKKRYEDEMLGRFALGTLDRIVVALRPGENMRDFLRYAVDAELRARGVPEHIAPEAPRPSVATKAKRRLS